MTTVPGFEGKAVTGSYTFLPCEEPLAVKLIFMGSNAWFQAPEGAWTHMRAWLVENTGYVLKDDLMGGHLGATTIVFPDAREKAAFVKAFDNDRRYSPQASDPYAEFAL